MLTPRSIFEALIENQFGGTAILASIIASKVRARNLPRFITLRKVIVKILNVEIHSVCYSVMQCSFGIPV